ncbi:type I secretion system permease/ATPase [Desulfonatronum lacustre]|uniref:type I secretion system permease/ATPase n=1 Tax=Desulfonatronum lacustre TaxID=66849 RepID=UPI0004AD231F|nr:type I secretion system permease/ATPase [Desulfonatronum lacustre]
MFRFIPKSLIPIYATAFFFSLFINVLSLAVPLHMLQIFDRVLTGRSEATLIFVTMAALLALTIMGVLEGLRSRLLVRLGNRVDQRMGDPVIKAMFTPKGLPGTPSYERGAADLNAVKAFLGGTGIFAFFDLPWLPIYLAVTFMLHPVIGMVSTVGAVVLFLLLFVNESLTRKAAREAAESSSQAATILRTAQRNVHAVYAMGMLPDIVARWQRNGGRDLAMETRVHNRTGLSSAMTKTLRMGLQAIILSVGAVLVIANEITAGVMIVGSIMMGKALQPLDLILAGWRQFQEARLAAGRLNLAVPSSDRSSASDRLRPRQTLELPSGSAAPVPTPHPGLLVRDLNLRLHDRPILTNVSLDLPPGRIMALVGPSGAGKTTLAGTLVGLYAPESGELRLDGHDLTTLDEASRSSLIGYLPQDVELLPATVGQNIGRMSDEDAQGIVTAAQAAGAHELILRLPRGYDTPVAPRAANLSAGQRQRIALARALYGHPRLLVLDEPDANLDDEGRQALARAIAAARSNGNLILLISHRPWILKMADAVIQLEEGKVITQQSPQTP